MRIIGARQVDILERKFIDEVFEPTKNSFFFFLTTRVVKRVRLNYTLIG